MREPASTWVQCGQDLALMGDDLERDQGRAQDMVWYALQVLSRRR